MKSIASATTAIANPSSTRIGAPRGDTGSEITSNGASREMHPTVMARSPMGNTEAAQSRMLQFGVTCSVRTETLYPMTEGGETTFRQKVASLTVTSASSADLPAALNVIEESLLPAPTETIEQWLAELSVKTARRKESTAGGELALSVYTAHLREFPADVVRHVLTSYRGVWFPTWGELADRMDDFVEPRRLIRDRMVEIIGGKSATDKPLDPIAEKLAILRGELEAAERLAIKYPDLRDSTERKRQAIADEIAGLER